MPPPSAFSAEVEVARIERRIFLQRERELSLK